MMAGDSRYFSVPSGLQVISGWLGSSLISAVVVGHWKSLNFWAQSAGGLFMNAMAESNVDFLPLGLAVLLGDADAVELAPALGDGVADGVLSALPKPTGARCAAGALGDP